MSRQTVSQTQAPQQKLAMTQSGLLQRKCACGNHTMAGGECTACVKNKSGLQRKLAIGASNDPLEHEADRVAEQVVSSTSTSPPVSSFASGRLQREAAPKEKTNEEKYQEGLEKLGEAFLQTPLGKELLENIKQDAWVKGATAFGKDFISGWPGKIVTGAAATGAVAALAVTHKTLPAQIPEIPLDALTPGLSVQLSYKGPVDKPTEAMITFKFTEQAPKAGTDKKPLSATDKFRVETARLAADDAKFRAGMTYTPGSPEDLQQKAEQGAARQSTLKFPGGPNIEALSKKYPWLATPQPKTGLQLTMPTPSFGIQPPALLNDEFKLKPLGEQKKKEDEPSLQKKLSIGASNDPLENEADWIADQVMAAPTNAAVSGGGAPLQIQRFTGQQSAPTGTVPASVDRVLASSGRPLEPTTRQDMEQRFGHDFSQVRVHADANAAESARAVNALAYTVGHHVAFGTGRYSPQTEAGSRLLAHELAHVVQQRRGPAAIHAQRVVSEPGDPAEREADAAADLAMHGLPVPSLLQTSAPVSRFPYQTVGTTLDRANIATLTGVSYWVQRTRDRYALTPSARMAADPEEQSAVLAALWASNPPATVTAHSERVVPVNPRPAPAGASGSPAPTAPPALLYRFEFDPPAPAPPGGKPRLVCEFIAAGPGAVPITAPVPAAGFVPGTLSANSSGFPGGHTAYFAAHPQEFAQLMSFLASAPPAFDRNLTTENRNARGSVTHTSVLHVVRGATSGGPTVSLDVDLVGEQAPLAAVSAPADYLTRDASDFEIEKLQRTSIAAPNRLGPVTLPAGLTHAEHLAVNLAITAYFGSGARNTEVDAIVPVGATGSATVLFTLRFGAANAVTVERIGAVGTGTGMVNTSRIDVRRIAGFPGATATDAALRAWWTARYSAGGAPQTPVPAPPATPTPGTAPAPPNNTALLAEMNALITAGIANTTWFSGNYGVEPLGPTAATTRLRDVHHAPAATHATLGTLADGTKSFSAADLLLLELSLQTASTTLLTALRGVQLIRMTNAITRSGTAWQSGAASSYGFTVMDGTERSTLLFDSFTQSDATLFRGGSAATALPDSTMSILHELGHAAGFQGGVETAFNAWRAAHPQTAQTWYAASAGGEVFPEAFALFQTDPHFLCSRAPLLYAWFLEWTTTGTPPAARATLTAPTTCPP